jgi:hypothetical protein
MLQAAGNRGNTLWCLIGALRHPASYFGVVGSTDETANKDVARGSSFMVGGSDSQFKPVIS